LNHFEKRNALGWEMHYEIPAALQAWEDDDTVSCVLFIGNEEIFCAGWALDILDGITGDTQRRFTELSLKFMTAIYDYCKPTVCAVAGVAPGYGMDVANMSDVTIASENAYFGSTQVKYAMNGFYGGMQRKCGPMRARRMFFTGDSISAQEAFRIGIVDELAPVGQLRERALKVAKRIAEMGPEMATTLKQVALRAQNMDHIGGLAYELRVTHDLLQRGIFRERLQKGIARLRQGKAVALDNISR
jgi:enoyl-CoA hydratase